MEAYKIRQYYFIQSYLELNGSILYGSGFYIVNITFNKNSDRCTIYLMDIDGKENIDFDYIGNIYNKSINMDPKVNEFRQNNYDIHLKEI